MKRHILTLLSFALVLPPATIATTGPSLASTRTCWTVVDAADGTVDGPEMETLCLDANNNPSFGAPTSYFGDISKCGTVTFADATLTVNLSRCDGNLPSHSIACQTMQSGKAHCMLTWAASGENRPVLLVPTSD